MLKRFIFASAALCFAAGCGGEQEAPKEAAALEVSVAKAVRKDVPVVMEFVGQTKGAIDAEIRARVEGVVESVDFEEGKPVKEGQLLYTIDPAPFNAKVAEARGRLAEAETKAAKAASDLKRVGPLVKMKALSERDLDAAVANDGAAKAAVDAAKASLDSANIELGYCRISAPTEGIIGISKAKVGEFVGKPPNPVVLNTVSKLNPIHVRFSVNEKEYLHFARLKQKEIEAGKNTQRSLELILADGSKFDKPGKVASVDSQIDATTGTLTVEAEFPNPNELIRPGQYGKVRTVAETLTGAITIPKRAVRDLQGQSQVFVVRSDNTVEQRNVTLDAAVGDEQIVQNGLNENDTVVTEGLQRLKTGMPVKPKLAG